MAFRKGNKRSRLLFCLNWVLPLLEKRLLKVSQRKRTKAEYFPGVTYLFILFPQSQDGIPKRFSTRLRAALHIKPMQEHGACVWRACAEGRWRSSIFTSSPIEVWCGGPAELETTSRAAVIKFWGSRAVISAISGGDALSVPWTAAALIPEEKRNK